jgi:alpha-D-ribose 1-methylphosphonate 5-triphosphate synthase subunit PhnG
MSTNEKQPGPLAPIAAARLRMMRVCADATETELKSALAQIKTLPPTTELRSPEQGLVMLRGRIGGSGRPFNLGEATVTRAVVALDSGIRGYAHLLGRCPQRAKLAAVVDALAQDPLYIEHLENALARPVDARRSAERLRTQEETAATRVDFFTVARGED